MVSIYVSNISLIRVLSPQDGSVFSGTLLMYSFLCVCVCVCVRGGRKREGESRKREEELGGVSHG